MNPPVAPYLLYGALITPVAMNNSMQSYQNSQHQAAVTSAAAGCGEVDDPPLNNSRLITKINHDDVLLGRGKSTINHSGNRRFRAMIEAKKVS
jgi:hypothetical protein